MMVRNEGKEISIWLCLLAGYGAPTFRTVVNIP